MAVRWTISFKTLNGHDGLVKVYDSNYSGNPVALEPADAPFTTDRTLKDMFQPVLGESGYLTVIDNGLASEHISDLRPVTALDRPVEFYIDNILKWRGYIKPESFTQPWEPAPREVSLPLVGCLEVLKSVNMEDNGIGLQPVAAFIKEILEATGFTWSEVVMIRQMLTVTDGVGTYQLPELRLSLSRYNFISPNTAENRDDEDWTPMVGSSYKSCLEDICRYFCLIAIPDGDKLYLTTPRLDVDGLPMGASWEALEAISADPKATPTLNIYLNRPSAPLSGIGWDGVDHRISVRNGTRKVILTTDIGYSDEIFPKVEFFGKRLAYWGYNQESTGVVWTPHYSLVNWLDPKYENVVLRKWQYQPGGGNYTEVDWEAPSSTADLPVPQAALVKADFWDSFTGKINYNYSAYIRLSADRALNGPHVTEDLPLCTLTAAQVGVFIASGAFCLSVSSVGLSYCNILADKDTLGLSDTDDLDGYVRLSLKVGDLYYNGSSWTDELTILDIPVDGRRFENQKTLSMPYNGAEGIIIPVDRTLNGRMEVTFYPWTDNDLEVGGYGATAMYIQDFQVGYYNDTESFRKAEGLRLAAMTGSAYQDEMSVNLRLSSVIESKLGHGILWWDGEPVGTRALFSYAKSAGGNEVFQPEYWLLASLVKVCGAPSQWLELQLDYDSTLLMWSLITYGGLSWLITSMVTDYAAEHTRMIIASYE